MAVAFALATGALFFVHSKICHIFDTLCSKMTIFCPHGRKVFGLCASFQTAQTDRVQVKTRILFLSLRTFHMNSHFFCFVPFNRMWVTYIVRHFHSKAFEVLFVCFVCTFLWTFRVQFSIKCTTKERKWEISKANTLFGFGFLFFAVVFFFFFFFSPLLCRSIFQGFFSVWASHSHSHTHITHHNTNHLVRIELCQFNSMFFLNLCVFVLWLLLLFLLILSLSFRFTPNPNNKSELWNPLRTHPLLLLLLPRRCAKKNACMRYGHSRFSLCTIFKCWEHDKLCAFSVSFKRALAHARCVCVCVCVIKLNVSITHST